MAMYVWYEGKNLRENFGIMKSGIKTEEAVDDIVDLQATEEISDISESIAYVNKPEQDKLSLQLMQLQKGSGVLFTDFIQKQRKAEDEKLEILLQNPAFKEAYARKYGIHPDSVSTMNINSYGNLINLPNSLFLDFNKEDTEIDQNSVYYTLNEQNHTMKDNILENESLQ